MSSSSLSDSDKEILVPGYGPGQGTWTCHICGDERPDQKISVATHTHLYPNGFSIDNNIRYCNDRAGCRHGARWKDHGALHAIQMERRLTALDRKRIRASYGWFGIGVAVGLVIAIAIFQGAVLWT